MMPAQMLVWGANGNPGCATFLAELYHLRRPWFERVVYVMSLYPDLRGSNGYMIWNDACERDLKKAFEVFQAIYRRELPIQTVRAHLAEGCCAPFKPEEFRREEQA